MNSIDKLTQIFGHFPGIGPRQAKRFVYYLLTRNNGTIEELIKNISELKKDIAVCADCKRFYERKNKSSDLCSICSDENRDHSLLMIVPRDSDLESVEKTGTWSGVYFVLGGTVPILEKEPEKRVRIKELKEFIIKKFNPPSSADSGVTREIIIAMNFNPEGENTADYIKKILEDTLRDIRPSSVEGQAQSPQIKISNLGKGLSTGTELEYADTETMRNALRNRS